MEVGNFKFHRRAFSALDQLSATEQTRVREFLTALAGAPPDQWKAAQARQFAGDPALYLVHVNDSLRVIVRAVEGQQPEVMDIVRRERLESFARREAGAGS